jgi:hypothetical protein
VSFCLSKQPTNSTHSTTGNTHQRRDDHHISMAPLGGRLLQEAAHGHVWGLFGVGAPRCVGVVSTGAV